MATKVAINGFGRIGRLVARAILERNDDDFELVSINDLADTESNALLFQYDSTHGRHPGKVAAGNGVIRVDVREIVVTSERAPGTLPPGAPRSEERRVGHECVSPCRSRCSLAPSNHKTY